MNELLNNKIIFSFKDIIDKIILNNYSYNYEIIYNYNSIQIVYIFKNNNWPKNITDFYKNLFNKIYKYDKYYWYFQLSDNIYINKFDDQIYINFYINIILTENLISYFEYIPRELLNIIGLYLEVIDITNYCFYLKTWFDYCNEDLYYFLYKKKFLSFYNLIINFIHYENNSWENRYRTLLWEEIFSLEKLTNKYSNVSRFALSGRQSPFSYQERINHVTFIIQLYNFLYNPNINTTQIINLYTHNRNLFYDLFNYLKNININRQINIQKYLANRNIII